MKNRQQLIEEYLYYGKQQRKLDEKTIRAYQIDLRQFSLFAKEEKLVMSKEVIRQYILHLHAIYKKKTVKRKIASIKAFYTYLGQINVAESKREYFGKNRGIGLYHVKKLIQKHKIELLVENRMIE